MVTMICTNCGYEGAPIKRPRDEADEGSDKREALKKLNRFFLMSTGIPIVWLAHALVMPLLLLKAIVTGAGGGKHCPNCGLPLMVSLKSDAGWMAKRKQDIKSGAIRISAEEEEKLAFGKQIVLPGDREKKRKEPPPPAPEKLPSLDVILEEPKITSAPPPDTAEKQPEPITPRKPAKPDEW
jgi:hypothetical protein